MKFRQHIRVYGYPEQLKVKVPFVQPAKFEVEGVGVINLMSIDKADKLKKLMDKHGIKHKPVPTAQMTRIRYLCMKGVGVGNSIRGRKYKGDILYTVEADDERELLDKRDAAIEELKTLRVKYEDVCKWVCETAPKLNSQKTFRHRRKNPAEKLELKIEGIQQEIAELKERPIKKAMVEDREVFKGVLR